MAWLQWLRHAAARRRWEREQAALRERLVESDADLCWTPFAALGDTRPLLRLVGGLDISFFGDGGNPNDDRACAAFIVCELDTARESVKIIWEDFLFIRMTEPYIPGFLAFREAPHYCKMLQRLRTEHPELMPDVIIVDGNGVLHPRSFGVASHVGVLGHVCTVGVAKNLHVVDCLDRQVVQELCSKVPPGTAVPLVGSSGRVWGAALVPVPRTPAAGTKRKLPPPTKPIYISVGHGLSLDTCVEVIRLCSLNARVPEPQRLADLLSREKIRIERAKDPLLVTVQPLLPLCSIRWQQVLLATAVLGLAAVWCSRARPRRSVL